MPDPLCGDLVGSIRQHVTQLDESLGRPPFPNPSSERSRNAARELLDELTLLQNKGHVMALAEFDEVQTVLPVLCASIVEGSENKKPCEELYTLMLQSFAVVSSFSTYPVSSIVSQAETILPFTSVALFRFMCGCGALSPARLCKFLQVDEALLVKTHEMKENEGKGQNQSKKRKGAGEGAAKPACPVRVAASDEMLRVVIESPLPDDCRSLLVSLFDTSEKFTNFVRGQSSIASAVLHTYGGLIAGKLPPETLLPTLDGEDTGFLIDSVYAAHQAAQQSFSETLRGLLADDRPPSAPLFSVPAAQWTYFTVQCVCTYLQNFEPLVGTGDALGCLLTCLTVYHCLHARAADFTLETSSEALAQWRCVLWSKSIECATLLASTREGGNAAAPFSYCPVAVGKMAACGNEAEWLLPLTCLAQWHAGSAALAHWHKVRVIATPEKELKAFLHEIVSCLEAKVSLPAAAAPATTTPNASSPKGGKTKASGQQKQKPTAGKGGSKGSAPPPQQQQQPSPSTVNAAPPSFPFGDYMSGLHDVLLVVLLDVLHIRSVTPKASYELLIALAIRSVDLLGRIILASKGRFQGHVWPFYKHFLHCVSAVGWSTALHYGSTDEEAAEPLPVKLWEAAFFCTQLTSKMQWMLPFSLFPSAKWNTLPISFTTLRTAIGALPLETGNTSSTAAHSSLTLESLLCPVPPLCVFGLVCGAVTDTGVLSEHTRSLAKDATLSTNLQRHITERVALLASGWADDNNMLLPQHPLLTCQVAQECGVVAKEDNSDIAVTDWMAALLGLRDELHQRQSERSEEALQREAKLTESHRLAARQRIEQEMRLFQQTVEFREAQKAEEERKQQRAELVRKKLLEKQLEKERRAAEERAERQKQSELALARLQEAQRHSKEEMARKQKEQFLKYQAKLVGTFRISFFLEQLGFLPTQILAIRNNLRDVADTIEPDDLLEFLVTGEKSVPADMRGGGVPEVAASAATVVADSKVAAFGGFWDDVMDRREATQSSDQQRREESSAKDSASHSFHFRVRRILDLFDYANGDEMGNLPHPLPSVKLNIVNRLIGASELPGFPDLATALRVLRDRKLVTIHNGCMHLTVLGFRYHYPFCNPDAVLDVQLEERRMRVRAALRAQPNWKAHQQQHTHCDPEGSGANESEDEDDEDDDDDGVEISEDDSSSDDEYDDAMILPEVEFGI